MGASSDAADQIVRITLDGVQTVAKISGEGALEIAKLLIKELKMPQQTKGRASLAKMIKSQKPMSVYTIEDKMLNLNTIQKRWYYLTRFGKQTITLYF